MVDYKKTDLSKRRHADSMLRMAEKILSIVYGGLLGSPAMAWITKVPSNDFIFPAYLLLLGIGGGLGVYFMKTALKCYASLDQEISTNSAIAVTMSGAQSLPECLDAEKPIDIVIERSATKISIRVE
jgi:hypothetical protein